MINKNALLLTPFGLYGVFLFSIPIVFPTCSKIKRPCYLNVVLFPSSWMGVLAFVLGNINNLNRPATNPPLRFFLFLWPCVLFVFYSCLMDSEASLDAPHARKHFGQRADRFSGLWGTRYLLTYDELIDPVLLEEVVKRRVPSAVFVVAIHVGPDKKLLAPRAHVFLRLSAPLRYLSPINFSFLKPSSDAEEYLPYATQRTSPFFAEFNSRKHVIPCIRTIRTERLFRETLRDLALTSPDLAPLTLKYLDKVTDYSRVRDPLGEVPSKNDADSALSSVVVPHVSPSYCWDHQWYLLTYDTIASPTEIRDVIRCGRRRPLVLKIAHAPSSDILPHPHTYVLVGFSKLLYRAPPHVFDLPLDSIPDACPMTGVYDCPVVVPSSMALFFEADDRSYDDVRVGGSDFLRPRSKRAVAASSFSTLILDEDAYADIRLKNISFLRPRARALWGDEAIHSADKFISSFDSVVEEINSSN